MRKYTSGMRWALWRWTMETPERPHIRRLHLYKTPWHSLYLHWKLGRDPQQDPHDHPVPFLSIVLRGGYEEHRYLFTQDGGILVKRRHIRWFNVLRLGNTHKIVSVKPGTVTLCVAGPPRTDRPWGFLTPQGFMPWHSYHYCNGCGQRSIRPIFCLCDFGEPEPERHPFNITYDSGEPS